MVHGGRRGGGCWLVIRSISRHQTPHQTRISCGAKRVAQHLLPIHPPCPKHPSPSSKSSWTKGCSSISRADARSAAPFAATIFSSTWSSTMPSRSPPPRRSTPLAPSSSEATVSHRWRR